MTTDYDLYDMTMETACSIRDQFNRLYPAGSRVLVVRDLGEVEERTIKWPASLTVNGLMIGLDGISGSYALSRVIPVPKREDLSEKVEGVSDNDN